MRPAAVGGLTGALLGYQHDTHLKAGWRTTVKTLIVVGALAAGGWTARLAFAPPQPVRGNVQVVTTLEQFTLKAGVTGNVIASFLETPGSVGALIPVGASDDPVRPVNEADLGQAFCSPSIAALIRHEYPGYYERWTDEKLETVALEKHPEYANRLCAISTRLDASPKEIIKYHLMPRTLVGHAWAALQALLATGIVALAGLNLYYRLIVGRLSAVD